MTIARRTHSTIDKLPRALQKALESMLVDNIWPDDYPKKKKPAGKPKYSDLVTYCMHKGYAISKSTIGRFGKRMRVLAKMKETGLIVRSVMDGITEENTSQTQKAVAELLTARAVELAANRSLNSKQIKEVAQGIRDCATISIRAEQYRQDQLRQKAEAAAKNIDKIITDKNIPKHVLKKIREQIYGIVK